MKLITKIITGMLFISCVFLSIGYFVLTGPLENFPEYKTSLFLLVLLGIIISMLVGYWIWYSFSKPLSEVEKSLQKLIEDGKDNSSLPLVSDFDMLTHLFHRMHNKVEESEKALIEKEERKTKEFERLKSNIEERMTEQTKQLQEKVRDLEKFQNLTIDRELKMIELKKQLEGLKNGHV